MNDLPAGVSVRPVAGAADIDAAYHVVRECELIGAGWSDATPDSVRLLLSGPEAVPGAALLAERDGSAVGVLAVEIARHGREIYLDAFAIGDSAARIQRVLLDRGLEVARREASADPAPGLRQGEDPYVLSADVWQALAAGYEQDTAYASLLSDLGMRPIRRYWRMVLDLAGRSPVDPPAPRGVMKRTVESQEDLHIMHGIFADSFAEHFGSSHDEPFEQWIETVQSLAGSDPEHWLLAYFEGDAVGICILDDSKAEFGEGYVRTLGVRSPARGRGIANWLLGCAAADAVRRGRTALALAVDGENTTGATELYRKAGFTVRQAVDIWCYPLLDD